MTGKNYQMKHVFSKHALEQMELRRIPKDIVVKILEKPAQTKTENGKKIFQSIVLFKGEGSFLVRIFVNVVRRPNVVITVYKTSQIEKYYEGEVR